MKSLIVSDLHYRLPHYDWLLKEAHNFDMIIIAGDLLDAGALASPKAQITVTTKYLLKLNSITKLIVCSGNHDLDAKDSAGEKYAKWINGVCAAGIPADFKSIFIDGCLFSILPWWDGPVILEKIEQQILADSTKNKKMWVWIYHTPPENSPTSWDGKKSNGDNNLNNWITKYQPDIVVCGHCHLSPFKNEGSWVDQIDSTWVFNTGMQIGPFPAHIILDTNVNKAAWFSLEGGQEVDTSTILTRPLEDLTKMPGWI